MPRTIDREQLKSKIDTDPSFELIDVLDQEEFQKSHLPRARHVPFDDSFDRRIIQAVPNKNQKVVVYCANAQCPASENAAQRMEELGYTNVYDYAAGKEDWRRAGLPTEGSAATAGATA